MSDPLVRQSNGKDPNKDDPGRSRPENKTFGEEGTNKTHPLPDPKAQPGDAPGGGKHMEPSPFLR